MERCSIAFDIFSDRSIKSMDVYGTTRYADTGNVRECDVIRLANISTQTIYTMAERIRPSSTFPFLGLVIENVVFTGVMLGSGADATVFEVDWNGTRCAAKRPHEILLDDQSAGGVAKLLSNFEAECLTWSKLRHPGVVQFLGVHMDRRSRLPVLVMEKMDTSLRTYLEDHSKEEFSLHQKAFVLHQVTQALAYLHNQNPPLVHHDLSSNNVLLNVVSYMTKVSDFGMSRAINTSAVSRKSSIKGTQAFMPPEALYNTRSWMCFHLATSSSTL